MSSPKSLDLNVTENIFDELNRSVRRTGAIPTTLNQLRAKILTSGTNFLRITFSVFVTSMIRRCLAVVNTAGGHNASKFTLTWSPLKD